MDTFDAPLLAELAADDIVVASFLALNAVLLVDILDSVNSVESVFVSALVTRSDDVFKFAELCNGMTKDESMFDDDDFSMSASRSIIKSPIPKI
jgi:hypothetical protein